MQLTQPEDTRQQMAVLSRSLKAYKRLRRNPNAAAAGSALQEAHLEGTKGREEHPLNLVGEDGRSIRRWGGPTPLSGGASLGAGDKEYDLS